MAPLLMLAVILPLGITTHGSKYIRHKHEVQVTSWEESVTSWQSTLFPSLKPSRPRSRLAGYETAAPVHAYQTHRLKVKAHQVYVLTVMLRKKRAQEREKVLQAQLAARRVHVSHASNITYVPPSTVFSGTPQAIAASMLGSYGWSQSQMGCLDALWNTESGWNYQAMNASSGAYGIPQALPGAKMASAGADWQTDPATQIRWGLGYIQSTYGDPCGAEAHELSQGWY